MKEGQTYQTNTGKEVVITKITEGYAIGKICEHGHCKFIPFGLDGVSWSGEIKLKL